MILCVFFYISIMYNHTFCTFFVGKLKKCCTKIILSAMNKLFKYFAALLLLLSPLATWADDCVIVKNGKEIPLYGKVQIVDAFPDLKVQIVDAFADLEVKIVNAFPDDCGKIQIVNDFPDVKVQIVNAFPDIKVRIVDAFPGITHHFQQKQTTK